MRKTALLVIIILLSFSCEKQTTSFEGFGGLNIGDSFTSLPIAKQFTKIMEDEFNASDYKLSDEIGSVSDLNVTTENGKISEVRFTANAQTNISEIEEVLKNMVKSKTDNTFGSITIYQTEDKKILFAIIKETNTYLKNGKAVTEYRYFDDKAVVRNAGEIRKMISSSQSRR